MSFRDQPDQRGAAGHIRNSVAGAAQAAADAQGADRSKLAAFASPEQHALWQRIRAHPFESDNQQLDLARRLAREQGWTLFEARAAVEEYRRFCFLAVVEGRHKTPSEAVDEVWHLHLIHSRDYWQVFCPQVLRCELHHGPTQGGRIEATRYREQYAATLAAYERWFGPPPKRWWPGHAERFANPARWQRVDRSRYWVLPRPRLSSLSIGVPLLAVLAALASSGALALPANPLDWTGGKFLALYATLAVLALLAGLRLRHALRDTGQTPNFEADIWQLAYLAGGEERVLDTAITELLTRDAIDVQRSAGELRLRVDPRELPDPLDAVARQIKSSGKLRSLLRAKPLWLRSRLQALEARGFVMRSNQALKVMLISALPLLAVLGLGVSKIVVGLGRGKPVDFLILLCVATVFAMLLVNFQRCRRSVAGDRLLAQQTLRHGRARRAPQSEEWPLAVALGGTAVLAAGPYASYHQMRQAAAGSGEGGGDSDGSGSGCGGCGGGD